ncbi:MULTISPECIES: hypothetical protein [Mycolicibacter]|uniref:DUF4129 domain-containing protein n=2 Tax=Mycolicibacter TaxID=1073531 RepID=A0ABU5XL29_9MYCO|nr:MULTISPECIES: hypothetical protein [unclassified Mycolicibacter]MEB3023001.1 hypothetical protein [Mycolicibacter sp. MYC098]MEB3033511.1 hypothetical protein [Mycolicibacter sp. MYC340]
MGKFLLWLEVAMGGTVLIALIAQIPKVLSVIAEDIKAVTDPASTPSAPPPTPAEPIDWSLAIGIGASILAALAGIGATLLMWRYVARRRLSKREQRARRADQIALWQQGVAVLAKTSEALMAFESDPESVYFTRRLLADVNEPATAAFYTAYDTAQSRHTEAIPTDTGMITAFVEAATAAHRAFETADENARRKTRMGISHDGHRLTADERRKIDQAQKLMRQAHDPALTRAHAHNVLAKALELLGTAGVIIPERLTGNFIEQLESIENIHRRALAGAGAGACQ